VPDASDDPRLAALGELTPAEVAHRRLGVALRRLGDAVYTASALGTEPLERAADATERAADELERALVTSPADAPRHDHWVGRGLSPEFDFTVDGDEVTGRGMFSGVQSGMPGYVHGGWIAQFFDEIMGRANLLTGGVFVTARLDVHYRRPTPVGVEIVARARRRHVDGRRVRVTATLSVDGAVTAEADALFVSLTDANLDRYADDPDWSDWSGRRYRPHS
jgi:hypothetical protein